MKKQKKSLLPYFFYKKGIEINYDEIKFLWLTKWQITGVVIRKINVGESNINTLTIHLFVFKSIVRFALFVDVFVKDICINSEAFSENPFITNKIEINCKCGLKTKIALINLNNFSVFFQKIKDKVSEYYLEISEISWNRFYNLMKGHLSFHVFQEMNSDDCLCIKAILRINGMKKTPFFNAVIDYDKLDLFHGKEENEKIKISNNFLYGAYKRKRSIEKVSYIKIESIPSTVVDAILCTEDPLFWKHKGVSTHFIGYAIGINIKEKTIKRGASTITMQLVKNLLLNNKKNFVRKIEEAIISLLLENYYLIDKRFILELYLNLIEFGPDVYGIFDASLFYFDKKIEELSITEIIVLTYIIPRPIHFYDALEEKTSQLKKNLCNHIRTYSIIMKNKRIISDKEYVKINYKIVFSSKFGTLDLVNFVNK